jgi:cystathionine beta-lyase
MTFNFDEIIERRRVNSAKWALYDEDVLPMWVADMDFRSPEPVIRALHERVDQGTFGYEMGSRELSEVIVERVARRYDWTITPDDIVYMPGLVGGINISVKAMCQPGDGVLMKTPVYGPFLTAPAAQSCFANMVELTAVKNERDLYYEIDFDAFEAAITKQTTLFLLCNPHNPVGRVYTRDELTRMADICLKHDVVICSDEIHCDLLLDGNRHIPTAALSPEIADKTITLMAASKTYNIAGFGTGFAIVQNADLREKVRQASAGFGHPPGLGFTASLAAYREGQSWLDAVLIYLQNNRDFVRDYVETKLPNITMARMEGTYLAWLDCREAGISGTPADFFLEKAKVALNDGAWFGRGGEGFVRLNFGAPRALVNEALERMQAALAEIH